MLKSSVSRVRSTSNKGPNNNTIAQQTTKKLDNSGNQRTQTGGTSLRALPEISGPQTLATEANGNHVIFLRGIRSDNGKIILTRDDNIRLQDGVLTVTNINKSDSRTGNESEKNDNEPQLHQQQQQQPNKTTVLVESGAEFGLTEGARRVNGTPVLFYTSSGSGSSDLTNGNVAFVSNDDLNLSEFTEKLVSHGLTNVEKPLEPELKIHCTPLGSDGEPIKLPENLESLPKADHFPIQRHRWNTNEEIAAILISFERHSEWQSKEVRIRPKSGSMLLYSRKKVRYRRDGYCWKKRKDGKTTREDHMKLKVQGTECIYGCYVHSAILPTFHRRCYWLLQNPDIVLVHYLNVPYPDDNKLSCITPSLALWADKKEWTKEELVSQLKPMFFSEDEPDINNELEISTAETVEAIVSQLMEKQRAARQAALVKQLECGCPDSTCAADGKQCSHPMRRIRGAEPANTGAKGTSREDANQVSSTTGCGKKTAGANAGGMILSSNVHSPRIYARESRIHHHHHHQQTSLHQTTATSTPPLVLSLSQIQGGGGLLILNSSANTSTHSGGHQSNLVSPVAVTSFVCNTNTNTTSLRTHNSSKKTLVLKQEAMDTNTSNNCLHTTDHHQLNKMDITNGNISDLYESLSFARQDKHLHQSTEMLMSSGSAQSTPSKQRMDTGGGDGAHHVKHQNFCGETVVLLGSDTVSKNDINNGFFNETLDLSQEDIQRTLSANMPMCELEQNNTTASGTDNLPNKQQADEVGQETGVIVSEMNPMDFMDGTDIVVSPTHVVDDDVFVNLDAFDMLGEFPELEVLDGSATGGLLDVPDTNSTTAAATAAGDKSTEQQQSPHMEYREGTANITDYSPEWAYPEGGVKVLVTGPWYSTTSPYTVLFDTFPVPTTLVQSGVLRCYCPAHEAGLATLQVACEGFVISNSVIFEYKLPPHEEGSAAPDTKLERSSDNLLKFTLLHRLEAMDDRLQIKQEPEANDSVEDSALFTHPSFEDRLVLYCQTLTSRHWRQNEEAGISYFSSHRGMTLLHLAASLGYTKLVAAMLHWRAENSSFLLETEVDALSQDEDGFTPLMWACARGHTETALMLYRWNHTALNIRNLSSQTALESARANGHLELAREVEKLESHRDHSMMMLTTSDNPMLSPAPVSPASSILSITSIASTNKSHDGVFLRPGAVNSGGGNSSGRYSSPSGTDTSGVQHKGTGQRLVKRPSVDSGINMTSGVSTDSLPSLRTTRSKTGRDIPKLSRFDRSMSLPLNSPLSANDNSYDSSSDIIRSSPIRRMDYTLSEGARSNSPLIDVEAISDEEDAQANSVGEQDVRVLTLAEQIIAAMPDRIKNEIEDMQLDNSPKPSDTLSTDTLNDVFMEPLLDQSSSSFDNTEFNFEFSDHNYRYYDVGTPCSSLSPASSSCLQSPCSFTLDSPSPPPTTADFCEFFQASGSVFEKDFSNLTLSDREQRELYEAAKIIQKAYRSYKGRQHNQLSVNQGCQQHEDKERAAAVLIQNYYRRYKQYAYFKQMTRAAMVIQSGYRSYCEHKRFKKSQEAAVCIQNYYRNYREQGGRNSRESTPASSGLKRTYSQRRQHQAARKIQQFMRQSKNKENEPKKRSRLSCSRRLSAQGHRVQVPALWTKQQQPQQQSSHSASQQHGHRNTNTPQQQQQQQQSYHQQQQQQQQHRQQQQQVASAQTLQTVADMLNSGWVITTKKSSRV